jgi:hypothetical protein
VVVIPHKFAVGDRVELSPGRFDSNVPSGSYTVSRLLPSETPDHQYRVKHTRDNHERVVRESQLRRA